MSTPVTYVGTSYSIPAYNDTGYAQGAGNLSSYLIALATGSLTLSGGAFTLTADANFGTNFGLIALYLKSTTANIATAGVIRLAKSDAIEWRNNANGANLPLAIDGSDNLTYSATKVLLSGAVVNADINAAAAIALTKLASTTAYYWYVANAAGVLTPVGLSPSLAVVTDSNGLPGFGLTTAAEIGYVHGVTSAIQTQLGTKAPIDAPTFTTSITTPLTASRAVATGAAGILAASATTATELGYVNGVTSAIQTQLGTKAPLVSPSFTTPSLGAATATSVNFGDTSLANYKEATWTPSDQSGAGLSLTTTYAQYTRIGRVVYVSLFTNYPATGNGAQVKIGGLPFTVAATQESRGIVVESAAAGQFSARFIPGSTNMELEAMSGRGALANSAISGAQLFVSGFYFV